MSYYFWFGMYIGGLFMELFYLAADMESGDNQNNLSRIVFAMFWPIFVVVIFVMRVFFKRKNKQ